MRKMIALAEFVARHPKLLVLTGAGCSTASGLGDYRDQNGQWKRRQPITGQTFIGDEAARKRYWARSSVGWPSFSQALPGQAHHALADLQEQDESSGWSHRTSIACTREPDTTTSSICTVYWPQSAVSTVPR